MTDATIAALRERMARTGRPALGGPLAAFSCDAGDCGGCARMIAAARLPTPLVPSPIQADMLLIAGPLTRNLAESVERAAEAMPAPGFVVAVGDCAIDGGVFRESYAVRGGVQESLPVDLTIRGCPPAPSAIAAGIAAVVAANKPE